MRNRLSKTEREEKVFNLIYKEKKYFKIVGRESPDFHLLHINGYNFGVEITEFFHNESSARRTVIPNYAKEILESEKYVHKDDKINLPKTLASIKIKDEDKPRDIYCIFYETPPIRESIGKLIKIIDIKEKSFCSYSKDLNHINLIIFDNENILSTKSEEDFYKIFFFKPLINVIAKSSFHEIYFITKQKDYGQGYLPLKSLYWSSTFFLYRKIFYEYVVDKELRNLSSFMKYLSICSSHLGFNNVFVENDERLSFYCGNSKISLKNNGLDMAFLDDNTDYRALKSLNSFLPTKDFSDFIRFVDNFSESAYLTLFIKI